MAACGTAAATGRHARHRSLVVSSDVSSVAAADQRSPVLSINFSFTTAVGIRPHQNNLLPPAPLSRSFYSNLFFTSSLHDKYMSPRSSFRDCDCCSCYLCAIVHNQLNLLCSSHHHRHSMESRSFCRADLAGRNTLIGDCGASANRLVLPVAARAVRPNRGGNRGGVVEDEDEDNAPAAAAAAAAAVLPPPESIHWCAPSFWLRVAASRRSNSSNAAAMSSLPWLVAAFASSELATPPTSLPLLVPTAIVATLLVVALMLG